MSEIVQTAFLMFLCLGVGTLWFSWMVPSRLTGSGFAQLLLAVVAGCLGVSWLLSLTGSQSFHFHWHALALIIGLLVLRWRYTEDDLTSGMLLSRGILFALGAGALFYASTSIAHYLYLIVVALLLGVTNYAMVLGHYYLVVPRLTEKPLVLSMRILWVIILARIGVMANELAPLPTWLSEGTVIGHGFAFNWILVLMRVLWGVVILGVLSIYGHKLAVIRSTQSATGVYYVMVFFALIGELFALYINQTLGVYL